jgi:hypothetical protein
MDIKIAECCKITTVYGALMDRKIAEFYDSWGIGKLLNAL